MIKIPTYSTSTKIPLNKSVIESPDVNDQITTVETQLQAFDNQVILTKQTTTVNVTANQDVYAPIDASGGAVTVNLPAGSTHNLQPIIIKKVDNTLNPVSIVVNGATTDKIEAPWRPETTPTFTTITLVLPNEEIAVYPLLDSAVYYWRSIAYQGIAEQVYANVYRTSNQALASSASFQIVQNNIEGADPFSAYDNATNYRFTVPVPGYYDITASVEFLSGTSSDMTIAIFKNGSEIQRGIGRLTTTTLIDTGAITLRNLSTVTTDYYDIRAFNNGAARNIQGTSATCNANFILKQRY